MNQYSHLSIHEREKILILLTKKKSLHTIAKEIGRSVATISRELKRNSIRNKTYSTIETQKNIKNVVSDVNV